MEQNKIWEYYQNEGVANFDATYKRLLYLAKMFKAGDRVLNIGVGGGNFEAIASKMGIVVFSMDPDAKAIARMGEILGDDRAKVGYIDLIPFEDNYFDGVVVSEVLEHLNSAVIKSGLKDINRVLKQGGRLIGTTPYKEDLNEQLCICPKCGDKFHRWGHIQSFDTDAMFLLLAECFCDIKTYPVLFLAWGTFNWKGKISGALQYVLFKMGLLSTRNQNLFFMAFKR
jgi:SAM-dependent methyltransferase